MSHEPPDPFWDDLRQQLDDKNNEIYNLKNVLRSVIQAYEEGWIGFDPYRRSDNILLRENITKVLK